MALTDEQRQYLQDNGLSEPTEEQLALLDRASGLDRKAIWELSSVHHYLMVEIAKLTGRTRQELENAR